MELSDRSLVAFHPPQGDVAMNPPDEFLKHAADCEQMAKFARDPQGKATWKRMAERWHRCAEKFTSESLAAHQAMAAKRRQGVAHDWAHAVGLQPPPQRRRRHAGCGRERQSRQA